MIMISIILLQISRTQNIKQTNIIVTTWVKIINTVITWIKIINTVIVLRNTKT